MKFTLSVTAKSWRYYDVEERYFFLDPKLFHTVILLAVQQLPQIQGQSLSNPLHNWRLRILETQDVFTLFLK